MKRLKVLPLESPTWDENSSTLDLGGLLSNRIHLFMGHSLRTFETPRDKNMF